MKKTILLLLFSFFCIQSLNAQDAGKSFHWDLRLGIGPTIVNSLYYTNNRINGHYYPNDMSDIYGEYNGEVRSIGVISAEWTCYLTNRIQVGAYLGVTHLWNNIYSSINNEILGDKKATVAYLLPVFKIDYFKRPMVRMYGAFGAGIGKYFGFNGMKGSYNYESGTEQYDYTLKFEGQITPFGIEVGRKLYGFLEIGGGSICIGGRIGVGYKF